MFKNCNIKSITFKSSYSVIYCGIVIIPPYGQIFIAYYLDIIPCICYAHFTNKENIEKLTHDLQKLWPNLELVRDDKLTKDIIENYIGKQKDTKEINVVFNGTDFQKKVWSALLQIPFGEERTYGEIAVAIGNPKAVRAVANAVGSNNIAIFIPCHRVKAKNEDMFKYRWGGELKKKILLNEREEKYT